MSLRPQDDLHLEIGHVLFLDIVGYSKLLIEEQRERLNQLTEIVLATPQVKASPDEQLVKLPTGDGMALVFRHSSEEPARCALEISEALRKHPELPVRMGINSGPVSEVTDISGRRNIAGAGINMAQRVMDCGDAGHILVSQRVAEDLTAYRQWSEKLHDLGIAEVKHGVRIHLFNLQAKDLGNPEPPSKMRAAAANDKTRPQSEDGFWIAVLPFKYAGANQELSALADGLSEDIATGLSRFSYLKIISRSSTARFAKDSGDIRAIGQELGTRYIMEGSLRQAGNKLRLAVQLVDAVSGAHLWAENYERVFNPDTIFELQDDLVPRIVSTVADQYGALVHSMSESLRGRRAEDYSPHEAVLRAFGYWERVVPEEHAEVRDILEAAVARAPDHSNCLAALSQIYWHEDVFGYNARPDPFARAQAAAQKAVASAPTNHYAHYALASFLFFRKDFQAFRTAADRTLKLNQMDASTSALLAMMIAYSGGWEQGNRIMERAMQLNPHHPGWYHYLPFTDAYRKREYEKALTSILRVNIPNYPWPHVLMAAVYGQLGEKERAAVALEQVNKIMPGFPAVARTEFEKWHDPELTNHLLDGLRKAGLPVT